MVSNFVILGCSILSFVFVVDLIFDFEGEIIVNNIVCGQYIFNGNVLFNYFGVVNYLWIYFDGFISIEVLINVI